MNKYHIEASTNIKAPIDEVWKIITDIKKYPEWNSFIRNIQSPSEIPDVNTLMKFEVQFQDGKKTASNELVKSFIPPNVKNGKKQAEWVYDFTGFLNNVGMVKASRLQRLTQKEDGTTDYYTIEKFSGWGKVFLPLKNVQAGFITHAADLKKHCEK